MGNLCSSGGRRGQNVALKTFVGFFFPRGINMGYNLLFFTWGNDRNIAGYDLQLQSSDQSSAYETWACILDTDIHLGGVNSLSLCACKHFFKNCFWSCESLTKWLTMWYWPFGATLKHLPWKLLTVSWECAHFHNWFSCCIWKSVRI